MLRHLKRVFISFSPLDPHAASARELLQRVGCDSARASNPACAVDFAVDEASPAGGARVELEFTDGSAVKLAAADYKVDGIVRVIESKAAGMEQRSVFAEVGFDPEKAAAAAAASAAKQAKR
jgi:large subunit ribosomal protein L53